MLRCAWSAAIMVCVTASIANLANLANVAHVQAQAQGGDKAAAEALFNQGRKLLADKQYPEACAKLEASQALDPGVGTLLNLADCYEKAGRTASAWAQFRETISAARKAGSVERERVARQRAAQLEPKLSYLTIEAPQAQAITVSRDGSVIDAAELGTAIPIDPGGHAISASAPGKHSWASQVNVGANAERVAVTVPTLEDEPQVTPPIAAIDASAAPPMAAEPVPTPASSNGSGQRVGGIVAAGIGVVGIATGSIFGIKAASDLSDAKSHCDPYPHCAGKGADFAHDAQHAGTISTIAFIVGGVGLVSGAILFFTAPHEHADTRTALDIGPGSIALHGRF